MKKVSVVILNYKVKDLAIKCLQSVLKSDYSNLVIYLVDNNSSDQIEDSLKKDDRVAFIQSGANLGYTGGNNLGIKKALENKTDYVFILNPDTVITPKTIGILITAAEKEKAQIVGPKIYFSDSKKIWYAGGLLDLNNVLGSHRGVDQLDNGQYDQIIETDYVTGAAMLVTKAVFDKIGLLDEKYFLYYEDSDFCMRAKKAGFKIQYIPQAVVYHANAKSTGLGSPLQDYFITRNRMLFAQKFLSFRTQFALFREALRNLGQSVRRQAFFDFLTGNLGKGSFIK